MPEVAIIVTAKDQASATLGKVGGSLQKLGKVAAIAGAAGVAALAGIAMGATKLALDAAKLEPTRVTFDNLSASIGSTADAMLKKLRPATMGIVSDADLMQAANKMLAMGLAETEDEAAKLSEMAVTLGMAMGEDATVSMENFALMMANQSIPRLDSFGISSAKVRERILELMAATEDMSREEAFKIAVMEQGAVAMEKVGDISGTSAVTMGQMSATISNLKMTIGQALLPILKKLLDFLAPIIQKVADFISGLTSGEKVIGDLPGPIQTVIGVIGKFGEWAKKVGAWVMDTLVPAIQRLFEWLADNLGPIFREFADEMAPRFQAVLKAISTFVTETLVPALRCFWERTEGIREAIVRFMGSAAVQGLKAFLEGLVIVWDTVGAGISGVVDVIGWLIDKIREVIGWFQTLGDRIPSWLIGGSASPLEISIRGIADAFSQLNTQMMLQPYTMSPVTVAGAGGGDTIINVGGVYGAWGPDEAIEDAFRDAARYSL